MTHEIIWTQISVFINIDLLEHSHSLSRLRLVYGGFHVTTAELSSCDRELQYVLLALYRKGLLTPGSIWHSLSSKSETPRITEWILYLEGPKSTSFHCIERPRKEIWHALQAQSYDHCRTSLPPKASTSWDELEHPAIVLLPSPSSSPNSLGLPWGIK